MAKFVSTVGTVFYIEKVIKEARKSITLITPFLKLNNNLIERLTDAEKQNIELTIIYGKHELSYNENKILYKFTNIEIFFCQNLHSKCYYNEQLMVISSMNLYEYSEQNNREMGIVIDKDEDAQIYEDTIKEIISIKNSSILEKQRHKLIIEKINVSKQDLITEILNEKYKETWNFHLPLIFQKLKESYNLSDIHFKNEINEIIIINFPVEGVDTEISDRINFRFKDTLLFEKYKIRYQNNFDLKMPSLKIYWNYFVINIYPPKDKEITLTELCKVSKSNQLLNIIETVKYIWS